MLNLVDDSNYLKIREWRNLKANREVMFTQHEISLQEHNDWWERVRDDQSKRWLIFSEGGVELGVVNFFDLTDDRSEVHWGFYFSDDMPVGPERVALWESMERQAIEYAFNQIKAEKLTCETLEENSAALAMHTRLGFSVASQLQIDCSGVEKKCIVMSIENPNLDFEKTEKYLRSSFSISFFGSSNSDFYKSAFESVAQFYKFDVNVEQQPFGRYRLDTFDEHSRLRLNSPDYIVFCERVEDLLPVDCEPSLETLELMEGAWSKYLTYLNSARSVLPSIFIIAPPVLVAPDLKAYGSQSVQDSQVELFVKQCEQDVKDFCSENSNSYYLDISDLISNIGLYNAYPSKYFYMARAPFSIKMIEAVCEAVLSIIMGERELNARVLVLDLDNTLWGGVIGDDGVAGIQIGGDYPGNVHKILQRIFVELRKQGFLIVLCSKNTESVALDAIENHPEMLIKKELLTSWRINWLPKPQNIVDIATELNLGIASFCFIDDNPLERAEMRASLPEVFVPELPVEVADWIPMIKRLPELQKLRVTDEDTDRNSLYRVRSKINKGLTSIDRVGFLETLEIVVDFEKVDSANAARAFQLFHKTNQFNTTTMRPTEKEFDLMVEGDQIRVCRMRDSLGSNEIVALFVLIFDSDSIATVDSVLMSCRVLGRGIESAILWAAQKLALDRGCEKLLGNLIHSDRNEPVRLLFSDHGFSKIDKSSDSNQAVFEISIPNDAIELPKWITSI